MMCTRKKYLCSITLIILSILLANHKIVQASENDSIIGYSYWAQNHMKVKLTSGLEDMEITIAGEEAQGDYGFVTIIGSFHGNTDNGTFDSNDKGGFCIDLSETANQPIEFSIRLEDKNNNSIVLQKDASIIIDIDHHQELYRLENGHLKLPASFEGKILIPFEAFSSEKSFDWNALLTYGLDMIIEDSDILKIELRSFQWIPNDAEILEIRQNLYIDGASQIELPVHGERIAQYTCSDNTYQLEMTSIQAGIHLDEAGHLTITTEAKPQELQLKAYKDGQPYIRKTVQLTESLRNSAVFLPEFPSPNDTQDISILLNEDMLITLNNLMLVIRILLITGFVTITALYFYFHIKHRRERGA